MYGTTTLTPDELRAFHGPGSLANLLLDRRDWQARLAVGLSLGRRDSATLLAMATGAEFFVLWTMPGWYERMARAEIARREGLEA